MSRATDAPPPSTGGQYVRTKDFQQATPYRFRILSNDVADGFVGWKNKKPIRKPRLPKVSGPGHFSPGEVEISAESKVSFFRAFVVWDYQDAAVKVWEVTQGTIYGPISDLGNDEDYGGPEKDATRFDFKVTKTGSGMETEYSILPSPPKDMDPKITAAWGEVCAKGFDLSALYAGGNPFEAGPPQDTFAAATGQKADDDIPF